MPNFKYALVWWVIDRERIVSKSNARSRVGAWIAKLGVKGAEWAAGQVIQILAARSESRLEPRGEYCSVGERHGRIWPAIGVQVADEDVVSSKSNVITGRLTMTDLGGAQSLQSRGGVCMCRAGQRATFDWPL